MIFRHPFLLKGVDRTVPAGDYRVVTDEELIEGLSFLAYRRVSTIFLPATEHGSWEMITVDPQDLAAASGARPRGGNAVVGWVGRLDSACASQGGNSVIPAVAAWPAAGEGKNGHDRSHDYVRLSKKRLCLQAWYSS